MLGLLLLAAAAALPGEVASGPPEMQRVNGALELYMYTSATDLNDRLTLIPPKTIALIRAENVSAELKQPDRTDPSIKAYMDGGPFRFYMPTWDVDALAAPEWSYRDCNYSIIDRRGTYGDDPSTGDLDWEVMIDAQCDAPLSRVRYYYDEISGLRAVSVVALENTDDRAVSQSKTYFFLASRTMKGFGARSNASH
jgi:hypothetical protein